MSDFNIREEALALFGKVWVWLCYIAITVVMKMSYMYVSGKRWKFWEFIAYATLSYTFGIIVMMICMKYWPQAMFYIVPAGILSSDSVIKSAFKADWKKIKENIIFLLGKKP